MLINGFSVLSILSALLVVVALALGYLAVFYDSPLLLALAGVQAVCSVPLAILAVLDDDSED